MEHFIKNLSIKNFKSIKSLDIETERINLFVGKPNVGKSNILEAISLLGLVNALNAGVAFSDYIRFNLLNNLFNDVNKNILIKTNREQANLVYNRMRKKFVLGIFELGGHVKDRMKGGGLEINPNVQFLKNPFFLENKNLSIVGGYKVITEFGREGRWDISERALSNVKKYQFKEINHWGQSRDENLSLAVPFGDNLFEIIQSSKSLRKQIASYFKEYGLDFVLDIENRKFEIQRRVDDLVYKMPYQLIAATLQRIIFHVAAIESNQENVLLFEEPESHSFPPYIRDLAQRIVESKTNQFFITTHSPYLFNTITSKAKKGEVAIFITKYVDHETKIKRLSEEDVTRLMDYGIDIFFNLNQFIDG